MSQTLLHELLYKLRTYKKKYYLNLFLKGAIFFFTLATSLYLIINFLEYYGRYSSFIRFILFAGFLLLSFIGLFKWVFSPVAGLFQLKKQISDEQAAEQIGKFFPEVSDKLKNTLQLSRLKDSDNLFIQASISQKTRDLSVVPFSKAVNLNQNRKYLKYLIAPAVLVILVLLFLPQIFLEGTNRIIHYNKEFTYPAPFRFIVQNTNLSVFRNDDFDLKLVIEGETVPEQVYMNLNGRRIKLKKNTETLYSYSFKNIQREEVFNFEAAGYNSDSYTLRMKLKPDLKLFDVKITYPLYLNKTPEILENTGNMTIPEGSSLNWNFQTEDVDKINLLFSDEKSIPLSSSNQKFSYSRRILKNESYSIELENRFGKGKDKIQYRINVIPDQYPALHVEQMADSTLYSFINLGGTVSDDYGLTRLKLFFRKSKNRVGKTPFNSLTIPLRNTDPNQSFIYFWNLDSLKLSPGENLEYYLEVWDNDGVHGAKSSKSRFFSLNIPKKEEIKSEIKTAVNSTETKLDQILKKSVSLKRELKKMDHKLKTKKSLDWQDKKSLEELLQKHEALKTDLEKLQKENARLSEQLQKFEQPNPKIVEKMKQLQKLMDDLLDEETKKLYDELQKMLQKNINKDELQKILEQLMEKDELMEKELDRSLEWFKQIQFDEKLNEIKKDLSDLAEEQKKLAEETEKGKKEDNEQLLQKQEGLNDKFRNLEKELEDLKKLNETLENKNDLKDFTPKKEEIKKEQQKASEQLKNNHNKKAGNSQKEAGEKMKQLSEQMAQMQMNVDQQQLEENMEDLRAILENLLKMSFDQEELMKQFRKVNQTDPRYLELSQEQLKLKDDSRIIEDSLQALAKRVFQIQSFVTRELDKMNKHLDGSIKSIRNRRPDLASGEQQFTMTSVNNLALMLNDVLKQMQEQMSSMSGGSQNCKKPGGKNKSPGLGELQKELNRRMQQLKNGNKPGEGMSKELAKIAAQQEMIRNALKELEKKAGGNKAGKELSELMKEMEKSEKDLVNKRINQELIKRQQEILTRLLEAEKSIRERDTDNERESNTGKSLAREIPPDFEKYLKEKGKQIELLKTVNPSFTPYYKKEVNEYFQKIEK